MDATVAHYGMERVSRCTWRVAPGCNENLDVLGCRGVLDSYGLPDEESVLAADISRCDAKCALAMILAIVRGDRFCEGPLLSHLDHGMMLKRKKRLEEIDGE